MKQAQDTFDASTFRSHLLRVDASKAKAVLNGVDSARYTCKLASAASLERRNEDERNFDGFSLVFNLLMKEKYTEWCVREFVNASLTCWETILFCARMCKRAQVLCMCVYVYVCKSSVNAPNTENVRLRACVCAWVCQCACTPVLLFGEPRRNNFQNVCVHFCACVLQQGCTQRDPGPEFCVTP